MTPEYPQNDTKEAFTLRLPKHMIKKLDEKASERGISRTALIASILDNWLKTQEYEEVTRRPRFEHINTFRNYATILDRDFHGRERIANVYFRRDSEPFVRAWCDLCDSEECVHVEYAWSLPKVREVFEKLGLKPVKKEYREVI